MQPDNMPNDDFAPAVPMPHVGYAFVLPQEMGETYSPEKGLMQGTIFPELDISMEKYGKQY